MPSTFYLDYEGGNDANSGVDFTNRWKTITSGATAARIAPGDTIRCMGSPAPTSLGVNGTFTLKSATVTLGSALNALISSCDTAWTGIAGGSGTTVTADTGIFRTNTHSMKCIVSSGFTTGKLAYFATGTLDLSTYQGITFWIRTDTALAAGTLSVRICTDTIGDTTPANGTFAVPVAATTLINTWYPVYVDLGTNLNSAIASVALYADLDPGTATIRLNNISAVKAAGNDSLNLQSLIGTNGSNETWWAIRNINGVTVTLDECPAMTQGNTARGYYSENGTQTVTAYKRETIHIVPDLNIHTVQDSGTAGNLITFSGGWDRTNMSTQTLETWFDMMVGSATVIVQNNKSYIAWTKISCVRGGAGMNITVGAIGTQLLDGHFNHNASFGAIVAPGGGAVIGTVYCCANVASGFGDGVFHGIGVGTITKVSAFSNRTIGFMFNTSGGSYTGTILAHNNGTSGVSEGSTGSSQTSRVDTIRAYDNVTNGLIIGTLGMRKLDFRVVDLQNNGSQGLSIGVCAGPIIIGSLTTAGNGTAGVVIDGTSLGGDVVVHASSISEATKITETSISGSSHQEGSVTFHNYNGTAGEVLAYVHGGAGKITTEHGANRHTASGKAWKMAVINAVITSIVPLRLVLASIAVNASALVTVTAYMRRSNTGLTASLLLRGFRIAGVDADVRADMTAAADTYEQLTITFTPTEAGVVDIEAEIYGGIYSAIIDDMTIAQA